MAGSRPSPRIPGFRLASEIASGASGTVYRAVQENLGRDIALKILAPGLFEAGETRARFLRETKIQARLSHPALLTLYDAGFAGDVPYLATELVEGGTLRDLLDRRRRLPVSEALGLAAPIAAGLGHAHRAGIVHRDLKPENVLLTREGQPKVADFGLAKSHTGQQTLQTASGVVLGTPGYISPEAIRGDPVGPPADVYAMGAMLFEMLAGERPFSHPDVMKLLRLQMEGHVPSLVAAAPETPAGLAATIEACLDPDPSHRPTVEALCVELAEPAASAEAPRSRPARTSRTTTPAASPRQATRISRLSTAAAPRSAPAAAASGPARPWLLTAAGGGLGLVLVAFLAWRSARVLPPAGRTGPATTGVRVPSSSPTVQGTRPSTAAATVPPVPEILRIARGATDATVTLESPAPAAGLPVLARKRDRGDWASQLRVAAGLTEFPLRGLPPATPCVVEVGSGPGARSVQFETLRDLGRGTMQLDAITHVRDLAVAVRGEQAVIVYEVQEDTRPVQSIRCLETLDGGRRWLGQLELGTANRVSGPSLALAGDSLVVDWAYSGLDGSSGLELRRRTLASPQWEPLVTLEASRHNSPLVSVAPGVLGLLYGEFGDSNQVTQLRWTTFSPSGGRPLPGRPAFPFRHQHGGCRCWGLFQTPEGLVQLSLGERERDGSSVVQVSVSTAGAPGAWTSPSLLLPTPEPINGTPELAVFAGSTFLTYERARQVVLRRRRGRDAPFQEVRLPLRAPTSLEPSLFVWKGRLWLACYAPDLFKPDYPIAVILMCTADGEVWDKAGSANLPAEKPIALRVAAFSEQLLLLLADDVTGLLGHVWRPAR